MSYKLLLADNDNTLMDFHAAEKSAIIATFTWAGIAPVEENTALYSAINAELWKALERGEITQNQLRVLRFERFLAAIGENAVNPVAMCDEFVRHLSEGTALMPGALDFVKTVSAVMPIAIVTNGISVIQRARIQSSAIAPFIRHLIISEEVGAAKPDPRILREAMALAGIDDNSDVILLGDSETADIEAANRHGIASIRVTWSKSGSIPTKATYQAATLADTLPILLGKS